MAADTSLEKRESQEIQRAERLRPGRTYVPHVDIVERDDRLLLVADMPGVRSDDVDIRYERGELIIHGKIEPRQDPQNTQYVLREYGIGDFYRVFQVGEGIDASKIERELGWRPQETFESGLRKTVQWYLDNSEWVKGVTSGAYREWVSRHYGA